MQRWAEPLRLQKAPKHPPLHGAEGRRPASPGRRLLPVIAINSGLFLAYVAIVVAAATDWLHDRLGGLAVAAGFLCLLSLYPLLVWALLRERNARRSTRPSL